MTKYCPHTIPEMYSKIEEGKNRDQFSEIRSLVAKSRSKEGNYLRLFEAMIYLSEATESNHIEQFNMKNVLIRKQKENMFTIAYTVSINLTFLILYTFLIKKLLLLFLP